MGIQPWYTTQTYPALTIPLYVETVPDNIASLGSGQFSMIMRPNSGSDIPGTGTFNVVANNPAVVTYTFSTADVASAFTGELIVKATFPNGGIAVYDPLSFSVSAI